MTTLQERIVPHRAWPYPTHGVGSGGEPPAAHGILARRRL